MSTTSPTPPSMPWRKAQKMNVYIQNLPLEWKTEELDKAFSKFGRITSSRILYNPSTRQSRGTGFVRFTTHEEALAAIKNLNGQRAGSSDQQLIVKFAKEKKSSRAAKVQETSDTNVYVCDLPLNMNKDGFDAIFGQYGTIVSSTILKDSNSGISRGIGFARFATQQGAVAAINVLNGLELPSGGKPLTVRFARDNRRRMSPNNPNQRSRMGQVDGLTQQMQAMHLRGQGYQYMNNQGYMMYSPHMYNGVYQLRNPYGMYPNGYGPKGANGQKSLSPSPPPHGSNGAPSTNTESPAQNTEEIKDKVAESKGGAMSPEKTKETKEEQEEKEEKEEKEKSDETQVETKAQQPPYYYQQGRGGGNYMYMGNPSQYYYPYPGQPVDYQYPQQQMSPPPEVATGSPDNSPPAQPQTGMYQSQSPPNEQQQQYYQQGYYPPYYQYQNAPHPYYQQQQQQQQQQQFHQGSYASS